MQSEPNKSIYAVVVTYRPDLDTIKEVIDKTLAQVDSVLVIDNGDEARLAQMADDMHTEYFAFSTNLGLAQAQNYGIQKSLEAGASHVLLMDQDSIPAPDMVTKLLEAERELKKEGVTKVGAIGARYIGSYASNESFFVRFGWFKFHRIFCSESTRRHVRADFLISSGALIPKETLQVVGMMDEDLFIDHIDTDWFLRANHYGYFSYGACDATMQHSLGDNTVRVWLGRWRYLPTHKPFRYYYIFRNSLLIYRKPYAPLKWIINDFIRLGFILVFYSLFVRPRIYRLKMMAKGFLDGIRERKGGVVAVHPGT